MKSGFWLSFQIYHETISRKKSLGSRGRSPTRVKNIGCWNTKSSSIEREYEGIYINQSPRGGYSRGRRSFSIGIGR